MRFIFSILILSFFSLNFSLEIFAAHNDSRSIRPIGVYSGSFDPPTIAHKKIMELALENYNLDKLYIFVNVSGPKDFKASFSEREAMIKSMLGEKANKIKLVPVLQENKDSALNQIQETTKSKVIKFIGQDSFETLPPASLKDSKIHLVVIPRGSEPIKMPKETKIDVLKINAGSISSSDVRKMILSKQIGEAKIDPAVYQYIKDHNLYSSPPEQFSKLQIKFYEEAFNDYLADIKKANPKWDLSKISIPPYTPEQSTLAWSEKFTNLIIKEKGLSGEDAEAFRVSSRDMNWGIFNGKQYPKMPSVFTIPVQETVKKPEIVAIKTEKLPETSNSKYTINILNYKRDRVPKPLQDFILEKKIPLFIHDGNLAETIDYHRSEGFTEPFSVSTRRGQAHRKMLLMRNPSSDQYRLVLAEVDGADRSFHVKSFTQFKDGPNEATVVQHKNKIPVINLNELGSIINLSSNDRVIIGYKGDTGRKLVETGNYQKITITNPGGADIDLYEHLKSKQKIILVRNTYGDDMEKILDFFYRKGVRTFTYMGSAGVLDSSMKVGDILIPNSVVNENGQIIHFNNKALELAEKSGLKNLKNLKPNTTHGWVSSIMVETDDLLTNLKNKGVQGIDIEAKYVAQFFKDRPDADISMFIFASDQPLGEITFDNYNIMEKKIDKSILKVIPVVTRDNFPVANGHIIQTPKAIPCPLMFKTLVGP